MKKKLKDDRTAVKGSAVAHVEMDKRLRHEIEHGRKIAVSPGKIWNWESPAGKRRWSRRADLLMEHIKPGMKVLELGCGTGYYTKILAHSGANVTSIDISPDLLEMAKREVKADNVRFLMENAYQMSFPDGSFDSVVGISVLHHLEIEKALSEIFRVLKKGGSIRFSEPNMLNPQIALEKNIRFIGERLGNSEDETAFFRWQMRGLLKRAGFTEIEVAPFDFLHPSIPGFLVPVFEKICFLLEKTPILQEFSGSLYIAARK